MRALRIFAVASAVAIVGLSGFRAQAGESDRMFGKHAKMREVAGDVLSAGTNWWGSRYIIIQDRNSGLRVYVQSAGESCVPGKSFKSSGHLTRDKETDYDATFHPHLSNGGEACF